MSQNLETKKPKNLQLKRIRKFAFLNRVNKPFNYLTNTLSHPVGSLVEEGFARGVLSLSSLRGERQRTAGTPISSHSALLSASPLLSPPSSSHSLWSVLTICLDGLFCELFQLPPPSPPTLLLPCLLWTHTSSTPRACEDDQMPSPLNNTWSPSAGPPLRSLNTVRYFRALSVALFTLSGLGHFA